ncbi:MAG TPA: hypothetical protein VE685_09040 [Thermoanaerobaculia bacterium]|nr:hypothetical protein [Thermoanaerobaculia bacterium]
MTIWKTPRRTAPALLAAALGLSALCGPASAHVMPLIDRQIAAGSPHVVVAVVEGARTRWNEQRTLLFTDYSLRVEDRLRGDAPDRITLAIPGGTLDGQTHGTCVSTHLETGARYLLFLQDLDRPLLVPITGGWQGVFKEVPGRQGKSLALRGRRSPVEFSRLVRSTRELIRQVEADPRPEDTAWMREVEDPSLPAKLYDPTPRSIPGGIVPALDEESESGLMAKEERPRFFVGTPAAAPLVFDPLPSDSPFSPADQEMLAYWNLYLKKPLFLVSSNPSPDWAYNNGISEIVGFPSSEEMRRQFGIPWFPGSYSAVFTVSGPDGRTVEIDIAMNPGRRWAVGDTQPDALFSREGTVFSFKSVVLQHLGTGWGYKGPYPPDNSPEDPAERTVDSIVGFGGFKYPTLLAVDAEAVRATFGGRPIRDGLVSPYAIYVSEGFLTYGHAAPVADSAQAGTSIQFTGAIKIENPGTVSLGRPTVEVYLVPERGSLDGAILLERIRVPGVLRSGQSRIVDLGSVTLPADTPAGDYYFAYVLRDPRDAYQRNNRAWSYPGVPFTVTR